MRRRLVNQGPDKLVPHLDRAPVSKTPSARDRGSAHSRSITRRAGNTIFGFFEASAAIRPSTCRFSRLQRYRCTSQARCRCGIGPAHDESSGGNPMLENGLPRMLRVPLNLSRSSASPRPGGNGSNRSWGVGESTGEPSCRAGDAWVRRFERHPEWERTGPRQRAGPKTPKRRDRGTGAALRAEDRPPVIREVPGAATGSP